MAVGKVSDAAHSIKNIIDQSENPLIYRGLVDGSTHFSIHQNEISSIFYLHCSIAKMQLEPKFLKSLISRSTDTCLQA